MGGCLAGGGDDDDGGDGHDLEMRRRVVDLFIITGGGRGGYKVLVSIPYREMASAHVTRPR